MSEKPTTGTYITIPVTLPRPAKWRPARVRDLGHRLHPEAVTDAWYAAECPPRLNARAAGLPLLVRLQWRVACALRGTRKRRV